jgi:hypothetical protein
VSIRKTERIKRKVRRQFEDLCEQILEKYNKELVGKKASVNERSKDSRVGRIAKVFFYTDRGTPYPILGARVDIEIDGVIVSQPCAMIEYIDILDD